MARYLNVPFDCFFLNISFLATELFQNGQVRKFAFVLIKPLKTMVKPLWFTLIDVY